MRQSIVVSLAARAASLWLSAALLIAGSCGRIGNDVLIMGDGSTKRGSLTRCTEIICELNDRETPRSTIAWIGLGQSQLQPPPVRDPSRIEIHLTDGSVRPTNTLTIDATTVLTDASPYPRASVRWIHLVSDGASATSTSAPGNLPRSYLWDGTIQIREHYDGENGSHDWNADFKLQFLEERAQTSSTTTTPVGDLDKFDLKPLAVSYTILARQKWDRGTYEYEDVHMNGQAVGSFTASMLADGSWVRGEVLTFDAPDSPRFAGSTSFATPQDFDAFNGSAWLGRGGYLLWVSLSGSFPAIGNDNERLKAKRAIYRGINKTGKKTWGTDPDGDFLHWVPIHGARAIGRLDRPDQRDVRGEYSYPVEGGYSSGPTDPGRTTVRWQFERKPAPDRPAGSR